MRIRTIKPEFWSSEGVASVTVQARLTFIGLWQLADDHGTGKANPALVKAALYPLDDCTATDVEMWITELESAGLIFRFSTDDRTFYHVPSWEKHQAAAYRRGEPIHPAPPSVRPAPSRVQESAGREQGREGKGTGNPSAATRTKNQSDAEVLLDASSRPQYLLGKLIDANPAWAKVTPARLMGLSKQFGPAVVISAVEFISETNPELTEPDPYGYLQTVCRSRKESA